MAPTEHEEIDEVAVPQGRGALRVGCSGFAYQNWRGLVYPERLPARRWLEHYATSFDTVELNATFYRLPSADSVVAWARQVPEGFCFAVKLGQFCSHRKKLADPRSGWLDRHLERVELFGPHLGPNLVQLPPRWRRDVTRLDEFLDAAPTRIRWAVELRDPSWIHDDVLSCLERRGAALCLHDLLPGLPWVRTAEWTYVRFHGPHAVSAPYRGRYTGRRLWRTADRLGAWLEGGVDVHAYFNNDVDANAVADATWLRRRLSG